MRASSGSLCLSFTFFSVFPQGYPILKTKPQPLPRIPTPTSYHHSVLHFAAEVRSPMNTGVSPALPACVLHPTFPHRHCVLPTL